LLVLLPENFALFGERQGYLDGAEPGNGPIQQQLSDWAKSHGIWLVAGAMPTAIAGADHIHTSTLVFDPDGELKGHYHKIHLFDVDVADNHGRYRSRRPSARVISLCWWTPLWSPRPLYLL
jgi:predicted amidohydrolase